VPHLNLDLDYFEHRKTKRLIGLLGRGAEVLPIKLWRYCGKYHAEDGSLADYTEREIEAHAEWWGKSGAMIEAMLKVGFLDRRQEGIYVHDWGEEQGHIAYFKKKGKAMAEARWGNAASIAASIAADNGQHCPKPTNQPTNQNRSQPTMSAGEREARRLLEKHNDTRRGG
jgi:hypothetical protein